MKLCLSTQEITRMSWCVGSGGRGESESPKILVGELGSHQKGCRRLGAIEMSCGISVDRPSVGTDERCYADEGVWMELDGEM